MLTLGAGVPLNGLVDFSMHAGAKRGRLQKVRTKAADGGCTGQQQR
jgi:hypothetical protein